MPSEVLLFVVIVLLPAAVSAITCNETHNPCEDLLGKGSVCHDGFCTNPFQGGCLRSMLDSPDYEDDHSESTKALLRRLLSRPRVCNSEDGPDVIKSGFCIPAENDYPEVRAYTQNWEDGMVLSWIMQIIYSELLGVPSTVESGLEDKKLNFYDEANRMDYGSGNDGSVIEARANVANGKDCTAYKNSQDASGEQEYIPCADIVMSLWSNAMESAVSESLKLNGIIGSQSWFTTLPSLEIDASLSSYKGLMGEENRRKLAETFKRPTTWKDYCTLVSTKNCSVDDGVATRPPAEDGSEDGKYFLEGFYTGYFRATEKNDCDRNPNCTGHFLDYPCGWTSYALQQSYHIGIALESDGKPTGKYSYSEMVDIWLAANATKSSVIGLWWGPDAALSLFAGTGSDLIPVTLPLATQECIENRIDATKRCDSNLSDFDLYGDSSGACGDQQITVYKIAAKKFSESNDEKKDNLRATMSPAYAAYDAFTMSTAEMNYLLSTWVSRGIDKFGFDLRFATCQWLVDNLEYIVEKAVPPSYPRTLVVSQSTALTIAAIMFGISAVIICVCTTGGITYKYRKGTLGKSAQISFLVFLLIGLIMVSVGGLLLAFKPSNGTCTSAMWFIVVGYPTMLIPMLIRVSAIIKIVRSSMKFKVVKVDKKKLIRVSIGLSASSAVYCIFWTIFDQPKSHTSLVVTDEQNDLGETVVSVSYYCDSESNIWFYVAFACQMFLLSCASSLAYQMRQFPNSVNDSKPLAMMIYSSFFFLALRVMVFIVPNMMSGLSSVKEPLQKSQTIFISLDTVTLVLIFFSRFFMKEQDVPCDKNIHTNKGSVDHIRSSIARRNSNDGSVATNTGSVDHFRNNIARRNSNHESEASALSEGKKERSGNTIRMTDGEITK